MNVARAENLKAYVVKDSSAECVIALSFVLDNRVVGRWRKIAFAACQVLHIRKSYLLGL